ncbi:hypothetical protein [Nocardia sp. XZ_19_369]|uniref:hypothetical protein n=1 Tax=Nocardia sp. XZ_19_369 TaxID=2769487 RepID=UPI00188DF16B|nr:hypothetical protein [Nocardia sp. XZ_19_369]
MSSLLVTNTQIDAIINAAIQHDLLDPGSARLVGSMLWRQNRRSADPADHGDLIDPRTPIVTPEYTPTLVDARWHPLAICKIVDFYVSQSRDTADWMRTEPAALCELLRTAAVAAIDPHLRVMIETPDLGVAPAYQQTTIYRETPWGITSFDQVARDPTPLPLDRELDRRAATVGDRPDITPTTALGTREVAGVQIPADVSYVESPPRTHTLVFAGRELHIGHRYGHFEVYDWAGRYASWRTTSRPDLAGALRYGLHHVDRYRSTMMLRHRLDGPQRSYDAGRSWEPENPNYDLAQAHRMFVPTAKSLAGVRHILQRCELSAAELLDTAVVADTTDKMRAAISAVAEALDQRATVMTELAEHRNGHRHGVDATADRPTPNLVWDARRLRSLASVIAKHAAPLPDSNGFDGSGTGGGMAFAATPEQRALVQEVLDAGELRAAVLGAGKTRARHGASGVRLSEPAAAFAVDVGAVETGGEDIGAGPA